MNDFSFCQDLKILIFQSMGLYLAFIFYEMWLTHILSRSWDIPKD